MALMKKYSYTLLIILSVLLVVGLFAVLPVPSAKAQTNMNLAAEFAPVLHFTRAEQFYPTSVEYVIDSSTLKERGTGGLSPTTVSSDPSPSNLGSFEGTDLFLDNSLGTLDAIAADYSSKATSLGYYTYVHVVNSGRFTVIQYWLLYAYNNGPLNNHQTDWEVVEVFLDASGTPVKAVYSQHGAGENTEWANIEKDGNHPVVYVAKGSHANFFRAYQGKMGIENDIVGNDGKTITPTELQVVLLSETNNLPSDQSWLNFAGRWGYTGNEQEIALGRAGPLGPVFNQDGIRWAQPEAYFNSTLTVDGLYFIAALLVANFLLIFLIYTLIRGTWKSWGLIKLKRKGGLKVKSIIKGRVAIGLLIGIIAVGVSIAGFFLPWYTMTASSQAGPLSQQGGTTLMNIDGVNGIQVNLFLGDSSDASSGFVSLASAQMPFAIIIAAGVILLALDIIGVKNNKSLGNKLIFGIIGELLPIIFIIIFIMLLPAVTQNAQGIILGQTMPTQITDLIKTIATNPIGGTEATYFPIVGTTTITWGLGIGTYLLLAAAILRVIGGIIIRTAPTTRTEQTLPPPPPPPT